mmetsp:Transcript_6092/g.9671  ORF Transcript_6092/g.9671 Transcript_6092/m.9671 type:complete len:735 (+) Transcript_6092:105-2309(+)
MKHIAGTLFLLIISTLAIAPPHPEFRKEHRKKRRRLNLQHNEIIKNPMLDRQFCSNLSESECRRLNRSFEKYSKDVKELINKKNTLRPLVLLVRFSDHTSRNLPEREEIDLLWNSDNITTDLPTGSIRRYLLHNSYDQLGIQAKVIDWKTTDNTELYYSNEVSGLTHDLLNASYPLLSQLDNEGYDFSYHDLNGDKIIDNLVLLHSGYPAEIGGRDCINQREFQNRIWAHAMTAMHEGWMSKEGFQIGSYMVASALRGTCSQKPARIGILTHELIHTWGIPDIYDTSGEWMGVGAGMYDIMSNPYGVNGDQIYPGHMGPWVRMESGWLNPIEIFQDGIYQIDASALSPSAFIIRNNFPEGEYLLIENRQNIEYDSQQEGSGLLIWHIDEKKEGNSERGYPGQTGWPGNGNHYKVAVLQADGNYDLEKGENQGDRHDLWTSGHTLCSEDVEFEASASSIYPNSNSYQGGVISMTNVCIFGISQSSLSMTFHVSGITSQPFDSISPSMSPSSQQPSYIRRPSATTMNPSSIEPYSIPIHVESLMPFHPKKQEQNPLSTGVHKPSPMTTSSPPSHPSASKLQSQPSLSFPTIDIPPSSQVLSLNTLYPSRDSDTRHSSPTIGKNVEPREYLNTSYPTGKPSMRSPPTASSWPTINSNPVLGPSREPTEYPTTLVWKEFISTAMANDHNTAKDDNFQERSSDHNTTKDDNVFKRSSDDETGRHEGNAGEEEAQEHEVS